LSTRVLGARPRAATIARVVAEATKGDTAEARLHSLTRSGERVQATLSVNGTEHVLSHRVVGGEPAESYDSFVVAATPIAMRTGNALATDGPISPRLLGGLLSAQRILNGWYPELRQIAVSGPPAPARVASRRGVASFFSAGLDSFYSALRHRERLDALIFVHGFDVRLDDLSYRERVARVVRRAAAALELPLVEVETDVRQSARPYTRWGAQYHGALLASIALVLENRFSEVVIPASAPATLLHPWGSHPDLDPLWSSDTVEVIHDGAVTRGEKLALITDSQVALDNLRVCFQVGTERLNCGKCEKCLRTMVGLRIAGALERCPTLPDEVPLRRLARTPIPADYLLDRARENVAAAEAVGDAELAAALQRMIRDGPGRAARQKARELRGRKIRRWWRRSRRALGRRRLSAVRRLRKLRRRTRERLGLT